jgi:hypothetical protein
MRIKWPNIIETRRFALLIAEEKTSMSQQPPEGFSGDRERSEPPPRALFDPYTGQRLEYDAANPTPSADMDRGAGGFVPVHGPPPQQRKQRGTAVMAAAALIALVVIGGAVWYINGPRADAHARESAQAASAAAAKAEARRKTACEGLLTGAYTRLSAIDSRLDVGMIEQDYTEAVGNAQVAYDQIDSGQVNSNECTAYAPLGKVVEQYSRASSYWNNCIVDDYCTVSTTTLNTYWVKSSSLLGAVKSDGLGHSAGEKS